jgi:hypothetical protein
MIHIRSGIYSWYVRNIDEATLIADFLKSKGMDFRTDLYERESDYFNVTLLNLN